MADQRKVIVLVVEDDEPLLSLFQKVLEQSGFEAIPAIDFERAQKLASEKRFDILVCDLSVVAGRDIFEFLASARSRSPKIASLIISGYTPDDIADRAKKLGVQVMEKPFTPPDLVERIQSLLHRQAA
jgi:DNA-binding response OmpR family regulator